MHKRIAGCSRLYAGLPNLNGLTMTSGYADHRSSGRYTCQGSLLLGNCSSALICGRFTEEGRWGCR
jgi:hypothetical protein